MEIHNKVQQGIINHIALLVDASLSMYPLRYKTVELVDSLVASIAGTANALSADSRVSIYTFYGSGSGPLPGGCGVGAANFWNQAVYDGVLPHMDCLNYDKDASLVTSIEGRYKPEGGTPLIEAGLQVIKDLQKSATLYGDHAFLVYVITDGEQSEFMNQVPAHVLKSTLDSLPDNWTVVGLAPTERAAYILKNEYGFKPGNVKEWSATQAGMEEIKVALTHATDAYQTQRSTTGLKSTDSIFTLSKEGVEKAVEAHTLIPLDPRQYATLRAPNQEKLPISEFVESATGLTYVPGSTYYHHTKRETVRVMSKVLVRDKETYNVFEGPEARRMIGLSETKEERLNPLSNPGFDVFVESNSYNRHLVPNTDLIFKL